MGLRSAILVSSFWILEAGLCYGQAGKAELFGTIRDPSELPVQKVKVELEDQATMARYSVVSSDSGEYHLVGLPAGHYLLIVEQPGFHVYRQSGIALRLDDRISIDVKLQIGQSTRSEEHT